jgi:hypothetical protein
MNYGQYNANPWGQPPMGMPMPGPPQPGLAFAPSRYGNLTVVDKVLPDMFDLIDNHW